MQKEDEDQEDSRDDEDAKPLFSRKPPEGPTESEKREHEVTHMKDVESWEEQPSHSNNCAQFSS